MYKKKLISIIASTFIMGQVQAIEPVFEGENGILAEVFASNCLACHSSTLTGSNRKGAPSGIDFDTYEAASARSAQAIMRAVTMMNMPPSSSSLPKLNEEQKQALTNWQAIGLPDEELPPIFSSTSGSLHLPKVYIKDAQGNITQKLMVEMALVPDQQTIQFELSHFHELELEDSSDHDHGRR